MSILAYTGLPGSGKSYNAVEQVILPALKAGRRVVTNIPLNVDKVRELVVTGELVEFPVQAVSQDPDSIKEFVTPGSVFVLDEVWRLWPQGQKADEVPEAFKSLLAEHRHMLDSQGNSVSIVLVVQDLSNIGAFARRLVEQTVIHTKLGFAGMSGRFRVDIYQGMVTGVTGPVKKRLREVYGRYSPDIYSLYKSHTMAQSASESVNEKSIDTRGNVLKKPMLIIGACAIPLLIWFGVHGLGQFVHSPQATGSAFAARAVGAQQHGAPVIAVTDNPVVALQPKTVTQRDRLRVVGWVKNLDEPSKSFVLIADADAHVIRQPFSNCREFVNEPLSCELEGQYISETGKVTPAGVNKPL